MPEAPVRFSTTTVWPSWRAAATHSARIVVSAVPPAGHGQTKVIGRSGQPAAKTRGEATAAAAGAEAAEDEPATIGMHLFAHWIGPSMGRHCGRSRHYTQMKLATAFITFPERTDDARHRPRAALQPQAEASAAAGGARRVPPHRPRGGVPVGHPAGGVEDAGRDRADVRAGAVHPLDARHRADRLRREGHPLRALGARRLCANARRDRRGGQRARPGAPASARWWWRCRCCWRAR